MKLESTHCPICDQETCVSWTERVANRFDAFERIICPLCNEGCVLIADIDGKETRYRCCNCHQ